MMDDIAANIRFRISYGLRVAGEAVRYYRNVVLRPMFMRPSRTPRSWHGQTLDGLDARQPTVVEGLEFSKCVFDHCHMFSSSARRRSIIRNVRLRSCHVLNSSLTGVQIEDVTIEGLEVTEVFILWGCTFRHVKLSGVIGSIIMNRHATGPIDRDAAIERQYADAAAAYYASVDWALDIRDAKFRDMTIRGVPAALIRRDPDSQVVVKREKVIEGRWRDLDLSDTHWPTALETFLHFGEPDEVLVAPKKARNYKALRDGLMKLRDAGVAEPD